MKLRTVAATTAAGLAWAALLAFGWANEFAGRQAAEVDRRVNAVRRGVLVTREGAAAAAWRWVPYNVCGLSVMMRVKASDVAPSGWAAIIVGIEDGVLLDD